MLKRIGEFLNNHFDTLFGYFIGAITSGSVSALITKFFEKKIFNKLSLGWAILIAIFFFICISIFIRIKKKLTAEGKKENLEILTDLANILELKDWDNFICGAELFKFNFSFYDERDNLLKYFEEHEALWSNKEKKMKTKIKVAKKSFEKMYSTVSKHIKPNANGSFLVMDKFYQYYYGKPEAQEKEKEFHYWVKESWDSINEYTNSLNDIVNYAKKEKYDNLPDCWKKLFLNHSYNN